jgi:hypothetical protein
VTGGAPHDYPFLEPQSGARPRHARPSPSQPDRRRWNSGPASAKISEGYDHSGTVRLTNGRVSVPAVNLIDRMGNTRGNNMQKSAGRLLKLGYPIYRPLLTVAGSLEIMARAHGTDKLGHGYITYYKHYFSSLRWKRIKLLEIGIGGADRTQGGASLRMWKDYFPRGEIFGIDIADKSGLNQARITTFQGSQDDPTFLSEIAGRHGPFDIVIDDGSHQNNHIITSFDTLFPYVSEDGYYVIEDVFFSYHPSSGGSPDDLNSERTSLGMLKTLVDDMHFKYIADREPRRYGDRIRGIAFYPKICFIRKGDNSGRDAVVDSHFAFLAAVEASSHPDPVAP